MTRAMLAVAVGTTVLALAAAFGSLAAKQDATGHGLWPQYEATFLHAKHIDLTHAMAPGQPVGVGFGQMKVGPARAAVAIPGVVEVGEPFTFEKHGAGITAYEFPTDQVATQLDPPAHFNAHGASISELPPTFAVRPLVVVDVSAKVKADPGYHATVDDLLAWERKYGRIPAGSVVAIRTDWSKRWRDPARFTQRPFPGTSLAALKFLHLERSVLMHGHEPLDTDSTPNFEGERWLLQNNFAQAEGLTNLDLVPEAGALVVIGYAKSEGGTGGFARYVAIAPPSWPHGVTIADSPGAPLPAYEHPLRRDADGVLRRAPPR